MKPVFIVMGVVVIAAIVAVIALSDPNSKYEDLIVNRDCEGIRNLDHAEVARLDLDMQNQLGMTLFGCGMENTFNP